MENVVLVLRTVLTVVNYDYVVDFGFYQTGGIATKAMSTGYVLRKGKELRLSNS